MPSVAGAPDFEQALGDLQDHLPEWLRTRDPSSELFKVLLATSGLLDDLALLWEQPYLDQALTTASVEGIQRNFALAWGLQQEQVPSVLSQLDAYIRARVQEDGSLGSLIRTLTALVNTPQNTTGGPILTFPPGANGFLNPNFEHDALSAAPAGWLTQVTTNAQPGTEAEGGSGGFTTFAVQNGWAAAGSQSVRWAASPALSNYAYLRATRGTSMVPIAVTPGMSITAGAIVNNLTSGGGCPIYMQLYWLDATGKVLTGTFAIISSVLSPATGGGLVTYTAAAGVGRVAVSTTAIAPVNAVQCVPVLVFANTSFGGTSFDMFVDQAFVAPTGVGYGDGDQPGWGWTGTPGASTSQQALAFPDPAGGNIVFPAGGQGLSLPVTFGQQPPGMPLFEFTPNLGPSASYPGLEFPSDGSGLDFAVSAEGPILTFPASGGGLAFPDPLGGNLVFDMGGAGIPLPAVFGDQGAGLTMYDQAGLYFPGGPFVRLIPNYAAYQLTVQVENWLAFDRAAFARAIKRFQVADWLPALIQEIQSYH